MSYEVAAYTLIFGCQEKSDAIAKIFFTFLTPYFECNFLTGQCCIDSGIVQNSLKFPIFSLKSQIRPIKILPRFTGFNIFHQKI